MFNRNLFPLTFVLSLLAFALTAHAQAQSQARINFNATSPLFLYTNADIIAYSDKVAIDSLRDVESEAIAKAMGKYFVVTTTLSMAGLPSPTIMSMAVDSGEYKERKDIDSPWVVTHKQAACAIWLSWPLGPILPRVPKSLP